MLVHRSGDLRQSKIIFCHEGTKTRRGFSAKKKKMKVLPCLPAGGFVGFVTLWQKISLLDGRMSATCGFSLL